MYRVYYNHIVSNHSDTLSLRTILGSISTLTAKWFNLGIALGLFSDTLKKMSLTTEKKPTGV